MYKYNKISTSKLSYKEIKSIIASKGKGEVIIHKVMGRIDYLLLKK